MFCEKLTEEQIRKVMNVISDDGALTILKIRTYDKSFEDKKRLLRYIDNLSQNYQIYYISVRNERQIYFL